MKELEGFADFKDIDVEVVARAIEADLEVEDGEPVPAAFSADLRQTLAELKAGPNENWRVTTPEQILVRQARQSSGLTQAAFAELIATPVATLRDWEQGRFPPPGAVTCLLRLIVKHPELTGEIAA